MKRGERHVERREYHVEREERTTTFFKHQTNLINMKKLTLFLSFSCILAIVGIIIACVPSQSKETTSKNQQKIITNENNILFAVVGFSSEQTNISLLDLKKSYLESKIYVLESVKPQADVFFQSKNIKIIKKLADFSVLAKDNILIVNLGSLTPEFRALSVDNTAFFDDNNTSNQLKYPLIIDKNTVFDYKNTITKFTLTGVTAVTRVTGMQTEKNGVKWLTEKLLPEFKASDLTHISNEVSFIADCKLERGMKFCSKEAHFQSFIDLGADIIELTGNHNLDYGTKPYENSINLYKKHNMQTFGGGISPKDAYKPLIITLKDNKKIAFVGYNELCPCAECADSPKSMGAARYDSAKVKNIISELKKDAQIQYIFASVQFGESDNYFPTKAQEKVSRYLVDIGADFVYGSQAHNVQYVEMYKGKPIFHGLGNFMFDQIHRKAVRQGFFLHNYIYNGKVVQSFPVFTFTADDRQPSLATTEQVLEIKKSIYLDKWLYK